MLTRRFAAALVVVVTAVTLLISGCESPNPAVTASSTTPVATSAATESISPQPSESPTQTATESPRPITPPESQYTDTALASMVAAVSVDGQQPQVVDAQRVRWTIASLAVSPDECAVLLTGLSRAAARGLPVAMATMGSESSQYTIMVVGADEPTREQLVTDRKLASKRCSKLSTSYGDPAGSDTVTTDWVVRLGTPGDDLDDAIEIDLTSDSGAQQRVVTGRLGNVLIQVSVQSSEPGGDDKLGDIVTAVAERVRASQGSAPVVTPTPTPSATPSR